MGAEWWLVAERAHATYAMGKTSAGAALRALQRRHGVIVPEDLLTVPGLPYEDRDRIATWVLAVASGECTIATDFDDVPVPGRDRKGKPLPGWRHYPPWDLCMVPSVEQRKIEAQRLADLAERWTLARAAGRPPHREPG